MDTGNPNDRKFDMGRMQRNEKMQYYWCPPHPPPLTHPGCSPPSLVPSPAPLSRFAEGCDPHWCRCSKTWMAIFSGCVTGILGFTGLSGFLCYVLAQLVPPPNSNHIDVVACVG